MLCAGWKTTGCVWFGVDTVGSIERPLFVPRRGSPLARIMQGKHVRRTPDATRKATVDIKQLSGSRVIAVLGLLVVTVLLGSCAAVVVASTALPGCESCHFDQPGFEQATRATPHGQVACVECHVQTDSVVARTKFGFYETFGMVVPILDTTTSDVAAIDDARCLACHSEVSTGISESRGIRINHSACAVESPCVDCHSEVGHGGATSWPRVVSMNDCVDCHKRTQAPLECASCHVGKGDSAAVTKPEFAVTHGPNWQETHGMGQMSACSVCHQEDKCAACHGPGVPHSANFVNDHPASSTLPGAKCNECHQKQFCDDCHGTEMPHPAAFASQHPQIVDQDGERPCMRCHAQSDCDDCHTRHIHPGGSVGPIPAPSRDGD